MGAADVLQGVNAETGVLDVMYLSKLPARKELVRLPQNYQEVYKFGFKDTVQISSKLRDTLEAMCAIHRAVNNFSSGHCTILLLRCKSKRILDNCDRKYENMLEYWGAQMLMQGIIFYNMSVYCYVSTTTTTFTTTTYCKLFPIFCTRKLRRLHFPWKPVFKVERTSKSAQKGSWIYSQSAPDYCQVLVHVILFRAMEVDGVILYTI